MCTCNGYLVPGTVCAPIISNLAFADCDAELDNLAKKNACDYSRYVDDITFSGDKLPGLRIIDSIITSYGFKRSSLKTYYQSRGKRQFVTGLTVFDKYRPRIPRWRKQIFRRDIYYMKKYGVLEHLKHRGINMPSDFYLERMEGLINFYRAIEPSFISKYEQVFKKIKEET